VLVAIARVMAGLKKFLAKQRDKKKIAQKACAGRGATNQTGNLE